MAIKKDTYVRKVMGGTTIVYPEQIKKEIVAELVLQYCIYLIHGLKNLQPPITGNHSKFKTQPSSIAAFISSFIN